MAIDKSGKWWTGSEPADIHDYLLEYSEENYPIDEYRPSVCSCGSNEFSLKFDPEEGGALRICKACKEKHFICDSEEYRKDAESENWKCVCGAKTANVGVGFSFYHADDIPKEKADVKWLYVGARCAKCGVLGCPCEWKIGYGPSHDLLDQV